MKVATVVLADTETHENLARVVNAMTAVKEFHDAGDDVKLIFDGAGTRWPGELSDTDHQAHRLYESVEDVIAGACSYCAEAFDATEDVENAGIRLLDEYKRHPSFRTLLQDGYEVLTF
ncbi:MAG: DsrE family protein [Actinobacteria bacterium]|nr:DsrE family protein [Actinomycetota bacterium]